jgi:hypothetical protein
LLSLLPSANHLFHLTSQEATRQELKQPFFHSHVSWSWNLLSLVSC